MVGVFHGCRFRGHFGALAHCRKAKKNNKQAAADKSDEREVRFIHFPDRKAQGTGALYSTLTFSCDCQCSRYSRTRPERCSHRTVSIKFRQTHSQISLIGGGKECL
jgi:hypothetical protein